MDTIRTVYLDSAYAEENLNGFHYNIIGGLSVAEGSRVYVDNISFTNTSSNVIGDNNDQVFLKTATNTAKVTLLTVRTTGHTRGFLLTACCQARTI